MALNSPSSWNIYPRSKDVTLDDIHLYSRAIFQGAKNVQKKQNYVRVELTYNKKAEKMQEAYARMPVIVSRAIPNMTEKEEDMLGDLFKKWGTPYSSTTLTEGSVNGDNVGGTSDFGQQSTASYTALSTTAAAAVRGGRKRTQQQSAGGGIVAPKRNYVRKPRGVASAAPPSVHYETQAYDDCEEFSDAPDNQLIE